MTPTALVILANGFEEMEAVISIDVLRRGGVNVTVAGLESSGPVEASRGVVLQPDASLKDAVTKGPYDAIVLPGGLKGAENLAGSELVGKCLKDQQDAERVIGAICAERLITSQGPGTSFMFALALVEKLSGEEKARATAKPMLL